MTRWQDIAETPDDPRVVAWREERIRSTARRPLAHYEDLIAAHCHGRRVLDFGAANHSPTTASITGVLTHDLVARHAREVVAVDIVPFTGAPHAHCRYVTANLLEPGESSSSAIAPVDTLFAGHVIEHLAAPGDLFVLAGSILAPGGELVIATPNPLWFVGIWARGTYRNVSVNADHVALFGASELAELGERNGFTMTEWRYAGRADMARGFLPRTGLSAPFVAAAYSLSRLGNLAFAHNNVTAVFARS